MNNCRSCRPRAYIRISDTNLGIATISPSPVHATRMDCGDGGDLWDLSYHNSNAASAKRARERVQRQGFTMNGKKIWSEEEDSLLRSHYPNYCAITKALPTGPLLLAKGAPKPFESPLQGLP